jgi:hypothetical protein
VTCKNGTVSTFGPDHDGDCYNYTNGQVTYATPMTCDNLNGRARYPTLAEYRQLIGEPFCGNIKTSDLTPALCRMPQ